MQSYWGIDHGGEVIKSLNPTGRSTGPHLHFEVSKGERFKTHVYDSDMRGKNKNAKSNRALYQKESAKSSLKPLLGGMAAGAAAGVGAKYARGARVGFKTATAGGSAGRKALGETSLKTKFTDGASKFGRGVKHGNRVGMQQVNNGNPLAPLAGTYVGGSVGAAAEDINTRKRTRANPKFKRRSEW